MKVVYSFSGGKDSLASILKLKDKFKKKNTIVVFCDTQWEHPLTYQYIESIIKQLDLVDNFRILTDSKNLGFAGLVKKKLCFPSATRRYCTAALKIEPMIDFILDDLKDHALIIQGIRHEESSERAKMNEQCTYFKYYLEPYDQNDWKLERLINKSKKQKLSLSDQKSMKVLKDKVEKGILEPKFYTYRKKEVLEYIKNFACDVLRPVIEMTAQQVIQLILDAGLKPNPLYYIGAGRVGCFPCIYVTKQELWMIIKNDYWVIEKIYELEKESGSTFFAPDYIPERYHTGKHINKDGEVKTICYIMDVVRYIKDKHATGSLFEEVEKEDGQKGCMSAFNICER